MGSTGTGRYIVAPVWFTHLNLIHCIRTPHRSVDGWAAAVDGSKDNETMRGQGEGWVEKDTGWMLTNEGKRDGAQ